jgi:hypothetical protein
VCASSYLTRFCVRMSPLSIWDGCPSFKKTSMDIMPLVQVWCFWTLPIVLYLSKTPSCLYFKTKFRRLDSVSVFRRPTQLSPIDRASPCLRSTSRSYLKTESSLRNVVLNKNKQDGVLDKDKTILCSLTVNWKYMYHSATTAVLKSSK